MSIYATHWILKFPSHGDDHSGCKWVDVMGQGVPAHIGTPTFGYGYESGDPYANFLPPAVPMPANEDEAPLRAMVVVRAQTEKVGQEYVDPLVVLSGEEYASIPFQVLYERICDALRGDRPRVIAEIIDERGSTLIVENDAVEDYQQKEP
jgi:hypothetical protein